MRKSSMTGRLGLAVLAGGLSFVGGVAATELVLDGGFENTQPSSNPNVKVGGKKTPGVDQGWSFFSTYIYSTLYTLPGPENAGNQYLRPYPSGTYGIPQSSDRVEQVCSLTAKTGLSAAQIDAGRGEFVASAWFSSYLTQGDWSQLSVEFLDGGGEVVGEPVILGGRDFVLSIPTGPNAKYGNAKEWAKSEKKGELPAGARVARLTITVTPSPDGAPDGYVDLVSLDVGEAGTSNPVISSAVPADGAVSVGPNVDLKVSILQNGTLDEGSIRLLLDGNPVVPVVLPGDATTFVSYRAGLLPALSTHTYSVIYAARGSGAVAQTNTFQFRVADYLTLPAVAASSLASAEPGKPGFRVKAYQVAAAGAGQLTLENSVELAESVLRGDVGDNLAQLDLAEEGPVFAWTSPVNWLAGGGAVGNFPDDQGFPGIPGVEGSLNNFVHEILTYVAFPTAGYYQMGVNSEDQFRLELGWQGVVPLEVVSPERRTIPSVPVATNITQLQFGGALPSTALTAPVVYVTSTGDPNEGCALPLGLNLAGSIALMDRGGSVCNSAAKAEQAQKAGAVAVILISPAGSGFPTRSGDANVEVTIPVLMISDDYGGAQLKEQLNLGLPVFVTLRGDTSPVIAEWNGPKGFGAVDTLVGFAVTEPGLYPLRLIAGQGSGRANLEWFTVNEDGTRSLVQDAGDIRSLKAYRARKVVAAPALAIRKVDGAGRIRLAIEGVGMLEEAVGLNGTWFTSPAQARALELPMDVPEKFYRVRQD